MRNLFSGKKMIKFSMSFLLAVAVASVTGCGAGSGVASGAAAGGASSVPAAPAATITLALTNNAGAAVTSITSGTSAIVKATVLNAAGAAVANAVVTFSTDATLGTISPISKTALTDASGVATVTLSSASLGAAGAATITATSQVGTPPVAVTGSIGYSVGAAAVSISTPAFGINPLSSFGTTSVAVTVSSNGVPLTTPQAVSFTSACASSGKAVLTASVTTVNGVATASYRDNGCAGTDTVIASVSGITQSSAVLTVIAPTTGSIQYVSATPQSISLKGTGGVGKQESSQVIFKVVDTAGNPIGGKTVTFSLSTAVGGVALTTTSAISDPTTGQVVVGINGGTVSTPVRVLASTCTTNTTPCTGTILSTQSDQLTITTGIPDQQNVSLSATTFNIEGWEFDGITTVITARVADHFNNPVPDGTVINFTAEGGSIVPSCLTTSTPASAGVPGVTSSCSVTFSSQALRPNDGRVTVLAYAVGEEGFTDLNGNGLEDGLPGTAGTEMIDANGVSTDMPEAWVDYNENGVRDPNEPFIDFNGNNKYDGPDGQYNGVLCTNPGPLPTNCSPQRSIHVRKPIVIVLSGSHPVITTDFSQVSGTYSAGTLDLNTPVGLAGCGGPQTILVKIVDEHGNLMPAGTTVAFATKDDGTVVSTTGNFPVENANTEPTNFPTPPTPAPGKIPAYNYSVTIKGDGTISAGACTDTTTSGALTVTVTTPKGVSTTYTIANLIN